MSNDRVTLKGCFGQILVYGKLNDTVNKD